MSNKYDLIVIGAGNGGLMSAAYAAKNGLKTLVLERHNIPGGCATSFVRGRFEFEPSLHELCFVGNKEKPSTIYTLFDGLGANIDWQYDYNCFRVINKSEDGYDAIIRSGEQAFVDSLEEAVPGSRESAIKFFELAKMTKDAMDYLDTHTIPAKLLTEYIDMVKTGSHSIGELLDYIGMPKKAQDILLTYWCYLGVPADDLNGLHFCSMVYSYIVDGAAMPAKRSHELSSALCKVILDNGGEIWYNSEVTGLIFSDQGRVVGVKVGDREIFAEEVFSNAIPHNIYNISERRHVPKKMRKLANCRNFGLAVATAYIGLDCTKEELGLKDYTIFVTRDRDTRKQYDNCGDMSLYIVNCLNVVVPDATPEGTCTLFLTMPLFNKDFPQDLTPEQYKRYKTDLTEKYIKDFEETMGIDIMSHIEEISIATPVTFARYLNTPQGTIYGYECSGWDNVMLRNIMDKMDPRIPGLTFVGGHTESGDGYNAAYQSGYTKIMKVIKEMQRRAK